MSWLSDVFQKGGPFFIVNTFFLADRHRPDRRARDLLPRPRPPEREGVPRAAPQAALGEQRRPREEAVRRDDRAGRARREGRPQPPAPRRGRRRPGDGRDDDRHAARGEDPHRRAVVAREHLHPGRSPRHDHRPHPHVRRRSATRTRPSAQKKLSRRYLRGHVQHRVRSLDRAALHGRPPAAVGRDEEGRLRPRGVQPPVREPARRRRRRAAREPRARRARPRTLGVERIADGATPHSASARRRAPRSGGARIRSSRRRSRAASST